MLTAAPVSGRGSDITSLMNAGELKNRFMELAGTGNLAKIFVTSTGSENLTVCYKPESKSFQVDPNTVYSSDGVAQTSTVCKSGTGTSDCYFCIQ
jgi:hypothetical protein